jgi:hypothetical protein
VSNTDLLDSRLHHDVIVALESMLATRTALQAVTRATFVQDSLTPEVDALWQAAKECEAALNKAAFALAAKCDRRALPDFYDNKLYRKTPEEFDWYMSRLPRNLPPGAQLLRDL